MTISEITSAAETAAAVMLTELGIELGSPSTIDTPRRMVAALAELTGGLREEDPAVVLGRTFDPGSAHPTMIAARRIPFTSLCEHHGLTFTGTATVAYLPEEGAPVVGLSKLARLVDGYARRPQMQERLGQQVIDAICNALDVQGAGCLLTAVHSCLTLRGIRAQGADMVTSHLAGCFLDSPVRQEFLTIAGLP
jgi:GTP cyclohydrolase I